MPEPRNRWSSRAAACEGKLTYETYFKAADTATALVNQRHRTATVYKCGFCNLFHIGRPDRVFTESRRVKL